jgi:hypothetical protein
LMMALQVTAPHCNKAGLRRRLDATCGQALRAGIPCLRRPAAQFAAIGRRYSLPPACATQIPLHRRNIASSGRSCRSPRIGRNVVLQDRTIFGRSGRTDGTLGQQAWKPPLGQKRPRHALARTSWKQSKSRDNLLVVHGFLAFPRPCRITRRLVQSSIVQLQLTCTGCKSRNDYQQQAQTKTRPVG